MLTYNILRPKSNAIMLMPLYSWYLHSYLSLSYFMNAKRPIASENMQFFVPLWWASQVIVILRQGVMLLYEEFLWLCTPMGDVVMGHIYLPVRMIKQMNCRLDFMYCTCRMELLDECNLSSAYNNCCHIVSMLMA